MVLVLSARRYVKAMGTGVTQAQLFYCTDDKHYVTKFKDNPEGVKVLVNELVVNRLALMLQLPVALGKFVNIPPELVVLHNNIPHLREGKHFGTVYADNSFDNPPLNLIETSLNVDCIAGLYVLDNYIANGDRHKGNIMVCQTNFGTNILLIDHSHCFTGPRWTAESLRALAGSIKPMNCQVHIELAHLVSGESPFDKWLGILENISNEQINAIIDEIPSEWNISEDEKSAIVEFLVVRRYSVRPLLVSMQGQFPNWKGGQ